MGPFADFYQEGEIRPEIVQVIFYCEPNLSSFHYSQFITPIL